MSKKVMSPKSIVFAGFLLIGNAAMAAPITLDHTWYQDSCSPCAAGDLFSNSYEWNSVSSVTLDVTDHFVIGESFAIYDFGALVFSTPDLPDYTELGVGAFDSGFYTTDPDVGFASPLWSSGSWVFAPGAHSITIQTLEDVPGFSDHYVNVRATVPEPSTLVLLGLALTGLGISRRRRLKA